MSGKSRRQRAGDTKPQWASKRLERRAARIHSEILKLSTRLEARYSAEQRRRNYPYKHNAVDRLILRSLEYERMPLPPDGRTQRQRDHDARLKLYRAKAAMYHKRLALLVPPPRKRRAPKLSARRRPRITDQ